MLQPLLPSEADGAELLRAIHHHQAVGGIALVAALEEASQISCTAGLFIGRANKGVTQAATMRPMEIMLPMEM
jgi:hypothetical protein